MPLAQSLRYGENPHQRAALYSDGSGLGVAGATQLQGKELSFNNLVDLDACWELVQEFSRARGHHRQAHQPLRRGHRRNRSRGLPEGSRLRSRLRLRLRHRHQPRSGRRGRRRDCQALCRSHRRARLHRRSPRALRRQEESAPGRGPLGAQRARWSSTCPADC